MSQAKIDVVICTHNPRRDVLQRTIQSIRAQSLPVNQWSFVIIDNCSDSGVEARFADWHPSGRIVREKALGLTPARVRAIQATTAPYIVFVDDDNELAADYLEQALAIGGQYSLLGVFGSSQILPEYEVEPSAESRVFMRKLAVRDVRTSIWSNDPRDGCDPWGAGMVVRRDVGDRYVRVVCEDASRMQLDRRGKELNSAGDTLFSWISCDMGLGKGIFPELRLTHLIDKMRITPNYLVKISEGHSFSHTLLNYLHREQVSALADRLKPGSENPGGNLQNSISHNLRYRIAWILAKFPLTRRKLKNRVRFASHSGHLRAQRLIEEFSNNPE